MREILFRGKPKNQNEFYHFSNVWRDCIKDGFVIGSLIVAADRYYICVSTIGANKSAINNGIVSMIEVIPETVDQYIGLPDKNGKKIFEGDLCLCNRNISHYIDKLVFEIKYDNIHGFYGESISGSEISADEFELCEIIGNIHDKPELLKEAEQE